jgi:hypothetical protein
MNVMHDLTLVRYAVAELGIWVWVTWAILLLITYGVLRAIRLQNRHYRATLATTEERTPDAEKIALFQLAKLRGDTLCVLWIIIAGCVIANDVIRAVNKARDYGATAAHANAAKPDDNPYADLEIPAQPQEAKTHEQSPQTLDDAVRNVEKIKSSYEDALVSYLILRRCQLVEKKEYETLYAAMHRALHFASDRDAITKGVLSAATGTYQSLYSDLDCSSEMMRNTKTHFALFLKQVALE